MALIPLPTPEQFATGWYFIQRTGEASQVTRQSVATPIAAYSKWAGEVPQIAMPTQGDPVAASCQTTINELARSNPAAAKQFGHDGLFKLMLACSAEGRGYVPPGYMQQVATALMRTSTPAWYMSLGTWVTLGVVGLVGAVWWNDTNPSKRKRRR
jgi:hypothetical protein